MKHTTSLNQNRLFKRVYYKGAVQSSPLLVIYMLKNNTNKNRIGITVSKKIGKAVVRNRAKRVIKAAYSELELSLPVGFDFVFVARFKTAGSKSTQIKRIMQKNIKVLACI